MGNVNRLRVGLFAPEFVLKDSEGTKLGPSHFRGKKNLLLLFCQTLKDPFCLSRLEELNRSYGQIQTKDTEILALSGDERWVARRIKEEKKIQFPILKADGGMRHPASTPSVGELYGVEVTESGRRLLCSAIFIVDKGGTIRLRRVLVRPDDELRPEELLCELDKLG